MSETIIAHLRFLGKTIEQRAVKSNQMKLILVVTEYPFSNAVSEDLAKFPETIGLYDIVFETRGEPVYPHSGRLEYYYDFAGVKIH